MSHVLFYLAIFICHFKHFNLPIPLQPHWPCCCFNIAKALPTWTLYTCYLFCLGHFSSGFYKTCFLASFRFLLDSISLEKRALSPCPALLFFFFDALTLLIIYYLPLPLEITPHKCTGFVCVVQYLFLSYCRHLINMCSVK